MTEPRDELRAALLQIFDKAVDRPDIRAIAQSALAATPEPAPDVAVRRLADTLMDLRMDGPWSRPPSELTYQEAMRHYARLLLAALHPADPSRREP